jgi:hypothetical protein
VNRRNGGNGECRDAVHHGLTQLDEFADFRRSGFAHGLQIGAGDKDGPFGAGEDDAFELRRLSDEIDLLAEFDERAAVKNVRGGIGPIERDQADLIVADRMADRSRGCGGWEFRVYAARTA